LADEKPRQLSVVGAISQQRIVVARALWGSQSNACPLGRDVGLKRFRASSNAQKKQTEFTNCEFKFEIRRRLSSRVSTVHLDEGIFHPSATKIYHEINKLTGFNAPVVKIPQF